MNLINMVGNEYCDTILYLARILQCLGDKVLISDNTVGIPLYFCIPHIDDVDPVSGIVDYRGMGYTACHEPERLERYEEFSTVIKLLDIGDLPKAKGKTIIITDERKLNVDTLNSLGWTKPIGYETGDNRIIHGRSGAIRYLVVRNFTGAIRNQFDQLMASADIRRMFEIPVSSRDEKCAILAMYKDTYRFVGLSSDYVSALIGIMGELRPEADERQLMRAYNMAARGRVCVV